MKLQPPTLLIATMLLCSIGQETQADAPLEGVKPAQWRVSWTANPSNSATVSWNTAQPGRNHQLRYNVRGDKSQAGVVLPDSGRFTGAQAELYYHHARLSDLKPATQYEVQMVSDGELSPVMYFATATDGDRPLSILHGGDSRSDQANRRQCNQLMARLVSESYADSDEANDVLALAHGGDYVASGTDLEQWSEWMSDHELTVGQDGRLLPVIPARGNHDKGELINQVFGFPDKDLNYYAIDLGSQVRFITLNTETSTAGDQAQWLDRELKASRASKRWLLAQYHRPAYPAVKAPSTALQSWVPLFEKHNVDLVCEADGHNIKRTLPIRGNVHDETGVVYIGEGGLGVQQRTPKSERWYLAPPGMSGSASHVFVLTFSPDKLSGKCVLLEGGVADRFELKPREVKSVEGEEK